MSRSSTWLSADAPPQASASPTMVTAKRPSGGTPWAPTNIPAAPVSRSKRHDPRLRQRQVVARRRERRRRAAERRGEHEQARRRTPTAAAPTCSTLAQVAPSLQATTPPSATANEERARPRPTALAKRLRIREPRDDRVRDEQRQRDRRQAPVRRAELEHGAHDDEAHTERGSRQPTAGGARPVPTR